MTLDILGETNVQLDFLSHLTLMDLITTLARM